MLDHLSIGVADISRSLRFYDAALQPLGIKRLLSNGGDATLPNHVGYGDEQKPYFWIGSNLPIQGYVHIAFAAASRELVDEFYRAALNAGGRDNGPPGLRPQYHPGYYGAFVLDPDGANIEAVHHSF